MFSPSLTKCGGGKEILGHIRLGVKHLVTGEALPKDGKINQSFYKE